MADEPDGEHTIEGMADAEERKRGRIPGLTNAEREARNAELIRDKLRGQGWTYLTAKYNLTERHCKDIYQTWREQNQATYQGRDPIAIVHGMLDRLEAWVEQLAEVADNTATEATEIAAINAQMNALTRTAELMQATGILPHDLGTLRLELDVQTLAVRLVTVLTEQGATPDMKRAILDTLRADAVQQPQVSNGAG
jgi:hypothetical protein